jgi:hypothetical protein
VAIYSLAVGAQEDRPIGPFTDVVEPDGSGGSRSERDDAALAALADDSSSP